MTVTLIDSPAGAAVVNTVVFSGALSGGTGAAGCLDVGWYNTVTISTIVDTRGNTWTLQQAALAYTIDNLFRCARYICERPTGGAGTITVTFSGNVQLDGGYLTEITGTITSGTITDQAPVGLQDTAGPFTSTTTGATAQASEVALACTHTYTSTGTTQANDWTANGYTPLGAHTNTAVWTDGIAYKVLSATGAQTSSLAVSGVTADAGLTFITTFKMASSAADDPPVRRPPQPPREALLVESVLRRARLAPPSGTVIADNPPTRRARQQTSETPPNEERVELRMQILQSAPDDPFLAPWADRGEASPIEERPRALRAPIISGAATADNPPLELRRVAYESFADEPRPSRRGPIMPVDTPPIERTRVPLEEQPFERLPRLRVTPDAVDPPPLELRRVPVELTEEQPQPRRLLAPQPSAVVPGDQPPNRVRWRAEEYSSEAQIQRLETPLPSGTAPTGDLPPIRRPPQPSKDEIREEPQRRPRVTPDAIDLAPLPARKRPEERADPDATQRRPELIVDGLTPANAPPSRARPLEAHTSLHEPTIRLRAVPPIQPIAADDPPVRRWARVEQQQPDETRPRRWLVYVAPEQADDPPMRARRVPVELASEEQPQRLFVTPPNAPIIPGDAPPLRLRQPSTEYQLEERPQRRALSSAIAGTVIVFHARCAMQAPPRRRTMKAPT